MWCSGDHTAPRDRIRVDSAPRSRFRTDQTSGASGPRFGAEGPEAIWFAEDL
jgi:hypothetical protein